MSSQGGLVVKIRTKPLQDGSPESVLCDLFEQALLASDPMSCVPVHLPELPENGRVVVVGAGKASAAMAKAVEDEARARGGLDRVEGIVVTRYGHAVACERIEIIEASHPVPDAAGKIAARRVLELARGLNSQDMLL
jgi:hydroxypyruvate reductase